MYGIHRSSQVWGPRAGGGPGPSQLGEVGMTSWGVLSAVRMSVSRVSVGNCSEPVQERAPSEAVIGAPGLRGSALLERTMRHHALGSSVHQASECLAIVAAAR